MQCNKAFCQSIGACTKLSQSSAQRLCSFRETGKPLYQLVGAVIDLRNAVRVLFKAAREFREAVCELSGAFFELSCAFIQFRDASSILRDTVLELPCAAVRLRHAIRIVLQSFSQRRKSVHKSLSAVTDL